jgi:hypothetical protein
MNGTGESFATPSRRQLIARLRPGLEAQHPSIGRAWHPVVERNPAALRPEPPPGSAWIRIGGRTRLLPVAILEFRAGGRMETDVSAPARGW